MLEVAVLYREWRQLAYQEWRMASWSTLYGAATQEGRTALDQAARQYFLGEDLNRPWEQLSPEEQRRLNELGDREWDRMTTDLRGVLARPIGQPFYK